MQDVKPLKNESLSYSSHLCPLPCLWLCPLSRAVLSLSPWKRGCLSSVLKSRSRRNALDPFSLPIAVVKLGIHTIVLQSKSLKWKWSLASAPRASHCLKPVDILELKYDRTIYFLNHKQVVCPKCCKIMKWVPILN